MIGRFLGQEVPAVGFSLGFERLVELVPELADTDERAVVLVHDRDMPLGQVLAIKGALITEGARVRLEQRPKNLKALLERAASDGYTSFATISSGASPDTLELKPLG
jgi:histidyl-tRNA synthetase